MYVKLGWLFIVLPILTVFIADRPIRFLLKSAESRQISKLSLYHFTCFEVQDPWVTQSRVDGWMFQPLPRKIDIRLPLLLQDYLDVHSICNVLKLSIYEYCYAEVTTFWRSLRVICSQKKFGLPWSFFQYLDFLCSTSFAFTPVPPEIHRIYLAYPGIPKLSWSW